MFNSTSLRDHLISIKNGLVSSNGISKVDVQNIANAFHKYYRPLPEEFLRIPISNYKSRVGYEDILAILNLEIDKQREFDRINKNEVFTIKHNIVGSILEEDLDILKMFKCNFKKFIMGYKYCCNMHPDDYIRDIVSSPQRLTDFVKRFGTKYVAFTNTDGLNLSGGKYDLLNNIADIICNMETNAVRNFQEENPEADLNMSTFTLGKYHLLLENINLATSDPVIEYLLSYKNTEKVTEELHYSLRHGICVELARYFYKRDDD